MKLDLKGKNIVITGTFQKRYKNGVLNRQEVESLLVRIGATVQKSVNGQTDVLINSDPDTGTVKYRNAVKFGIRIITEDEFHLAYGSF